MNNIRPGALTIMIGGALLFISSFLDWFSFDTRFGSSSANAYNGSLFGLTGLFLFVIAAVVIAVAALRSFAPETKLPDDLLGLAQNQVVMALGFSVFVLAFSLLFRENSAKIGTILALLSSGAVVVGGFLEQQAGDPVPSPPPVPGTAPPPAPGVQTPPAAPAPPPPAAPAPPPAPAPAPPPAPTPTPAPPAPAPSPPAAPPPAPAPPAAPPPAPPPAPAPPPPAAPPPAPAPAPPPPAPQPPPPAPSPPPPPQPPAPPPPPPS
ncbi:MAG: hypothetical protein OEW42_11185 [Acidimicrobiia bacterium]|nr:hypothetical protein [Acidimicrobiia bacterium]